MEMVRIFDTTLRDGEQAPGFSMNTPEKLRLARRLESLGVDVIEAGFPIASRGDFEAVREVAREVKHSTVAGLARTRQEDIDAVLGAVERAAKPRVHTFLATSDLHLKHKLRISRGEALDSIGKMVEYAKSRCPEVEFSAEDASRSDIEFLAQAFSIAVDAGAAILNAPDTVGYATPEEYGGMFRALREKVGDRPGLVWSAHCHNDLGLAVANSLAAVQAGARQVECTINGIGERAGNASLEEIVMAVRTRRDVFDVETGIDTTQIVPTSRLVSNITGYVVQPNKAIVGANAFAHESGIHQDGVLKHRETYEIMRAEDVGWHANRMVLGKHSGRNAFRARLSELGIEFKREEDLNEAFMRFKELADKKHDIYDEDLQALVTEASLAAAHERVKLVFLKVHSETGETPRAEITLSVDGEERDGQAEGSGPVDATFRAIESIMNSGCNLQLFSVNAITTGTDAQGEVTVRLDKGGRIANGQGADTDILVASAKAYINALNKVSVTAGRTHPQVADHI